jgi:hypothetical protein
MRRCQARPPTGADQRRGAATSRRIERSTAHSFGACLGGLSVGGVWTSCPTGSLDLKVREPSAVSRYSFGTKTAEFHICARFGVVPAVTRRIAGKVYALVSVNAFEEVDASLVRHASTTFDAETEEARLARRMRNWIPNVVFSQGEA